MTSTATLTVTIAKKAAQLGDVKANPVLQLLGNRSYSKGILAVDGANAENVQTTNAVEYSINGIMYSKAAVAEIDLSGLTAIDENGVTVTDLTLAAGYTKAYLLVLNAGGDIRIVPGLPVANGGTCVPPSCPADHAPFGAVKVVNASSSAFTFGTTDTDAASITSTFYDLAVVPPSL